MPAVARLLLWDIDRTLLDAGRLGRQVYAEAFHAVTGRQLRQLADLAGRTDHDIILDTLALHGLPAAEATLEAFYDAIADAASARRGLLREHGRPLSGARQALDAFAAVPNLRQSVVTGNIRSTAELKLSAFDLDRHLDLDVGGYGCDDGQRAVLVRLAIERAERHHGVRYGRENVAVIGDTPHDIAGARANAVRAVGVATGSSTADDLDAAGADAVLADLTDTAAVLRAVLGA
jgi:phosphoglycolate phosphatase